MINMSEDCTIDTDLYNITSSIGKVYRVCGRIHNIRDMAKFIL